MFLVIFVIIVNKITIITIIIIIAIIIIIIGTFFLSYAQNVLTSEKKGPSRPNWGVGGFANSGNARNQMTFSMDPFP